MDGRHQLAREAPDAHLGLELVNHQCRRRPVDRGDPAHRRTRVTPPPPNQDRTAEGSFLHDETRRVEPEGVNSWCARALARRRSPGRVGVGGPRRRGRRPGSGARGWPGLHADGCDHRSVIRPGRVAAFAGIIGDRRDRARPVSGDRAVGDTVHRES